MKGTERKCKHCGKKFWTYKTHFCCKACWQSHMIFGKYKKAYKILMDNSRWKT